MKADLHVHTWYSNDSGNRPKLVLKFMNKRKIDLIAVTNHDTPKGWTDFPKGRAIPGIEFSTRSGHLLGLWVQDVPRYKPGEISFEEALDVIKDNDGLSFIAHPFDYHRSWGFNRKYKYYADRVDGIEVCNYKNKTNEPNRLALNFAKEYKLLRSAGSDAHLPYEVGNVYVKSDATDPEQFRKRLIKGDIDIHCTVQPLVEQFISFTRSIAQRAFNIYGRP